MKICYNNWVIDVMSSEDPKKLIIDCKIGNQIITREYYISEQISKIEFEGDYLTIYVNDNNSFYYCNFSSDTEFIADKYVNDEFELSLGCYDFYDDYNLVD